MILHIAGIELSNSTGMGRIALEWKKAFERKGMEFKHIAAISLPNRKHHLLDGWLARKHILQQGWKPQIVVAHEPLAGWLKFSNVPLVSFSHGLEERRWLEQREYKYGFQVNSRKAAFLPKSLRFRSHNKGFALADLCLLSNSADERFLKLKNITTPVFVFKNGHYRLNRTDYPDNPGFLFNATWLPRKGIAVLISAFNRILVDNRQAKLLLAGTFKTAAEILPEFSAECHHQIEVIPEFDAHTEAELYSRANIFVLPSYFEGQSLALTQAMAMGLCPVAADNSGQVDVIKHGENGLLFKTGNSQDLTQHLQSLLDEPQKLERLQNRAAETVKAFTWEKVADDVVDRCLRLL